MQIIPCTILFLIWLLPVVGKPSAFCHFHVWKSCFEWWIFWTTSVNSKLNFSVAFPHVADSHLFKSNSVVGTFYTIVVFSAAKAIPHWFYACWNFRCCPVGISAMSKSKKRQYIYFLSIITFFLFLLWFVVLSLFILPVG